MSDQVILLIAVNGFVLTAFCIALYVLLPSRYAAEADGVRVTTLTGGFQAVALKLSPRNAHSTLQHKLDIAGNPLNWGADKIFTAKTVSSLVLGLIGLLAGSRPAGLVSPKAGIFFAVFLVFGFDLPNMLVSVVGARRQEQIQKDLPDVLDLMSVTMRAGLGFDAAVARVATNSNGPLAMEFARMLQEFRLGVGRAEVLRSLVNRSTVSDLHHVVQALIQADSLGVPVADVLTAQAKEMRIRRRQRAEERAQKVTIKILFPVLFCIFPALLVVILGPAVVNIMNMFAHGGV